MEPPGVEYEKDSEMEPPGVEYEKDSGMEPPGVEHVFIHEKGCISPDQSLQTL